MQKKSAFYVNHIRAEVTESLNILYKSSTYVDAVYCLKIIKQMCFLRAAKDYFIFLLQLYKKIYSKTVYLLEIYLFILLWFIILLHSRSKVFKFTNITFNVI